MSLEYYLDKKAIISYLKIRTEVSKLLGEDISETEVLLKLIDLEVFTPEHKKGSYDDS